MDANCTTEGNKRLLVEEVWNVGIARIEDGVAELIPDVIRFGMVDFPGVEFILVVTFGIELENNPVENRSTAAVGCTVKNNVEIWLE